MERRTQYRIQLPGKKLKDKKKLKIGFEVLTEAKKIKNKNKQKMTYS